MKTFKEYKLDEAKGLQAGDWIVNNNGEEDFFAEIDFIDDGAVYFTSGDDQYYSELSDCKKEGKMKGKTLWRAEDYEG